MDKLTNDELEQKTNLGSITGKVGDIMDFDDFDFEDLEPLDGDALSEGVLSSTPIPAMETITISMGGTFVLSDVGETFTTQVSITSAKPDGLANLVNAIDEANRAVVQALGRTLERMAKAPVHLGGQGVSSKMESILGHPLASLAWSGTESYKPVEESIKVEPEVNPEANSPGPVKALSDYLPTMTDDELKLAINAAIERRIDGGKSIADIVGDLGIAEERALKIGEKRREILDKLREELLTRVDHNTAMAVERDSDGVHPARVESGIVFLNDEDYDVDSLSIEDLGRIDLDELDDTVVPSGPAVHMEDELPDELADEPVD
jgi:hypothetical protein